MANRLANRKVGEKHRLRSIQTGPGITDLRACRGFDVSTSSPEAALKSLARAFPECISVKQTTGGLLATVPEQQSKVERDDQDGSLFCACSPEQIQSIRNSRR
jgi:hypothetical protein